MNILKTESISKINYHISVVNSLRQYWRTNKRFSCIGKPKAVNLFLYLDGCDADYIDKNGKTVVYMEEVSDNGQINTGGKSGA